MYAKKTINSLKECVFVNSALNIHCHIVKNTFLQIAFSAILPTGYKINKKQTRKEGLPFFKI